MPVTPGMVTKILQEVSQGNRTRINQLVPLVYDELYGMAQNQLYGERAAHTLNATALAHEAYLKMVDADQISWQDRCHFYALAAQSMRRILIDYARSRNAQKRSGEKITLTLVEDEISKEMPAEEILELHEALKKLSRLNERQGMVIEYWFFGGLTHQEIARVLNISVPSVRRDWRLARAWLSREMGDKTR